MTNGGHPVQVESPRKRFRVVAMMAAFNEADIIGQVLHHLIAQGIEVYVLDHGSTDQTHAIASSFVGRGVLRVERFPEESGFPAAERERFALRSILQREEELAASLDADWFLHHDADEIRECPWPGVTLHEAIRMVDRMGFTAVDFHPVTFVPDREGFSATDDPVSFFRSIVPTHPYNRLQVKCWKKTRSVDLASTGGHQACFSGREIFPVRFLLRHYPLRSRAQAERKVLRERLPRYAADERELGWHVQYDQMYAGNKLLEFAAGERVPFDFAKICWELHGQLHRGLENAVQEKSIAAQRYQAEIAQMAAAARELTQQLQLARTAAAAAHAAVQQERLLKTAAQEDARRLRASRSWRLTMPLRWVHQTLRTLYGKTHGLP